MSNFDNGFARFGSTVAHADAREIDRGLRAYMISIYNFMAIGVAVTGLIALVVYNMAVTTVGSPDAAVQVGSSIALTEFGRVMFFSPLKWVIAFAPIGLVFLLGFRIDRMQPSTAQGVFFLYAALVGASLATIFLVYTHASIARVFFISAAAFGGLSLWGYTTQRSLSGMGSFLMMGLIGIIIASLVNMIWPSGMLQFAISVIGVLVFSGLTAWDTQKLKEQYVYGLSGADEATVGRSAVLGALSLYLDFINLFMMLLQLFGQRSND